MLKEHNITYLMFLAEVKTTNRKLTKFQKRYDKELSLSEASPSVDFLSKNEFNNEDDDMLDQMD